MAIFQDINMSTGKYLFLDRLTSTGNSIGDGMGIGNPFGLVFLLAVLFITFMGARSFSFARSFLVSTFFGTIISIFLVALGWLSSYIIYIMVLLMVVAIIFNLIEKN